jgi:endonuclease/exonuclease/phosphatase family metal-dependent hydrolase
VRLYDYGTNQAICVGHMHGLRDLRGKLDTPERRVQAERLVALVRTVAEDDDPLIVGGDFNVEPGSETFGVLAGLGLTDLVTSHGHAGTRTSHYTKPGRFADYLLVNDRVAVREFSVVTTPEVSDHCPLVLELDVNAPPS